LGQYVGVMLAYLPDEGGDYQRDAFTRLAHAAHRSLRATDVLGRYNERTLCLVLPGVDVRVMTVLRDRMRRELKGTVTFKVAASVADGGVEAEALFSDAESRLLGVVTGSRADAVGRFELGRGKRQGGDMPRVLVVDTDEAIVELLTFFCAREGMAVDSVADGQAALAILDKAETTGKLPDLVMLDVFLPGMDAMTVIDRIHRRFGARVPVIAMSVSDAPDRVAGALDAGALDVISKPFSVTELMARLRRVLARAGAL
ncbi:MAG: response regulator, partial [Myxococcales bacterium]|nr:response regulator [Myxococcales bacterium]